jgi:hypothetical protein
MASDILQEAERKPSRSEIRRQEAERGRRAEEVLRAAKRRRRRALDQIEAAFAADGAAAGDVPGDVPGDAVSPADARAPTLERWASAHADSEARQAYGAGYVDAFRRLLLAAASRRSRLLDERRYVDGFARLAREWARWVRPPEAWQPRSHNPGRQFAAFARHLLARYPVPRWLDQVWLDDGPLCKAGRGWFVHLGAGLNLRTAPGLPFPLTKAMAHAAAVTADAGPTRVAGLPPGQVIRWAQLVGLGVSDRVARAAAATRHRDHPTSDEPFWLTFGQFLSNNPMLDPAQVGPIVDYRSSPPGTCGTLRPARSSTPGRSSRGSR